MLVQRKKDGPTYWRKRKYFSHACQEKDQRKYDVLAKPCRECGNSFERRPGEAARRFAERYYCCEECRNKGIARSVGIAKRAARPKKTPQRELEVQYARNIYEYWKKRGVKIRVDLLELDDNLYAISSNLVGGVPR